MLVKRPSRLPLLLPQPQHQISLRTAVGFLSGEGDRNIICGRALPPIIFGLYSLSLPALPTLMSPC